MVEFILFLLGKFFFFPCEPGCITIWGGGLLSKALILAEKIFFNSINMNAIEYINKNKMFIYSVI